MTADLDHTIRSSLGDIIAAAPHPDDQPMRLVTVDTETPTRRPYLAVAASLVVLAGVAGLVAIRTNDPTPTSPAAAPVATDDSLAPGSVTTLPIDTASSAAIDVTTTVFDSPELIPVGAVVCIDAGAGQRAADLCAQELGGPAIAGTSTSDSSFVMPVDPTKPADVAGTANAAAALNLPVADFDAELLPPSLVPPAHATTYLVLGQSNPYSS